MVERCGTPNDVFACHEQYKLVDQVAWMTTAGASKPLLPACTQVIIAINEIGVPEALEQGPKSGKQLATELDVHQEYLERVLRVADRLELICTMTPDGTQPHHKQYKLTQLSAVLCESHPNSVKHMVALFGDHFPVFSHLTDGIRTGQTPYMLYAKGQSHWEHMKAVPQLYTRFNK
jgi:hypothetical protein